MLPRLVFLRSQRSSCTFRWTRLCLARPGDATLNQHPYQRQRLYGSQSTVQLQEPDDTASDDVNHTAIPNTVVPASNSVARQIPSFRLLRSTSTHDQEKANLPTTSLGKPTEVLILRDALPSNENDGRESKRRQRARPAAKPFKYSFSNPDDAHNIEPHSLRLLTPDARKLLQPKSQAEHAIVFPPIDAIQVDDQDAVNYQLEQIRPNNPSPGVLQPALHPTVAKAFIQKLASMFNVKQLDGYYQKFKFSNPELPRIQSLSQDAVNQANSHYRQYTSSSKPGPIPIEWLPWNFASPKSSSSQLTRSHVASLIVHSVWEVGLHQIAPFRGHALLKLPPEYLSLLSANNFAHLSAIAQDWNVQFDIHSSALSLVASGPQRNVKMAITQVIHLLCDVHYLEIGLSQSFHKAPSTPSQTGEGGCLNLQELNRIASQTKVSVDLPSITPENKHVQLPLALKVVGFTMVDVNTARILLSELLFQNIVRTPYIESPLPSATKKADTHVGSLQTLPEKTMYTYERVLPDFTNPQAFLVRKLAPVRQHLHKDSYKALEPIQLSQLKTMRQSVYDTAVQVTSKLPASSSAAAGAFWSSEVRLEFKSTLGHILHRILPSSRQGRTEASPTSDPIFVPDIRNLMLAVSRASTVEKVVKSRITITTRLFPSKPRLPAMLLHFQAVEAKHRPGIFENIKYQKCDLILHEQRKNVGFSFAQSDAQVQESCVTPYKLTRHVDAAELERLVDNLVQTPSSQDQQGIELPLHRAYIPNPEDKNPNSNVSGKSTRDVTHVEYTLSQPEIRRDIAFLSLGHIVSLSTVQGFGCLPTRTELYTKTAQLVPSKSEEREVAAYDFAKKTAFVSQALLSLTNVSKSNQVLLSASQRSHADLIVDKLAKARARKRRLQASKKPKQLKMDKDNPNTQPDPFSSIQGGDGNQRNGPM